MIAKNRWSFRWLTAAVLLCAPAAVLAADPATKLKAKLEGAGDAMEKPADNNMDGAMGAGKSSKSDGKAADKSEPDTQIYRFKAEKKGTLGEAPAMVLGVEDAITGKAENLIVANSDPAKLSPVAEVADALKEISPGDLVQVGTEKVKGRKVAKSLAKAEIIPGEDRPKGYVFLGWDRKKGADGKTVMGLRLRKFGRELMVMVPVKLDPNTGNWNPTEQVDYVLGRVKAGETVEADIKPGNPPTLEQLWEYYGAERGKFIGIAEVDYQGMTAAAVEMTAEDGTTLKVRLRGTEQYRNGKRILMPDPKELAKIQRIKPDSTVEVFTHRRNDYVLREINVISPPEKKTAEKGEKSGKGSASSKNS